MNTESMYTALGITPAVHRFGEEILAGLRARFDEIDRVAEYNQCKVIGAMQRNRVDATHFAATTGYGYNDAGRDNLERVYADCFHTEAALVRPQITCGTHALTIAPILTNGDITGAVAFMATDDTELCTDKQSMLAKAAAMFLGKQIEE